MGLDSKRHHPFWSLRTTWVSTAFFFFVLIANEGVHCIAITKVGFLSDDGNEDYVLQGKGATFTCYWILQPDETGIESVRWTKDDETVYEWQRSRPPEAKGVFQGRVDSTRHDPDSPSTVVLTNITIDMHGTYECHVQSDKGTSQSDVFLTVISGACKEDDFRSYANMTACTERIEFQCSGMFPKPSPACGVYNELTGAYMESVPFDHTLQLPNKTYQVTLTRQYYSRDWLNFTDITFRCYIKVLDTSWRRGIKLHLFGDQGCMQDPPTVDNGDIYWIGPAEKTCWGTPREGTRIYYRCHKNYRLVGSSTMVCLNKSWVPVHQMPSGTSLPYCSGSSARTGVLLHSTTRTDYVMKIVSILLLSLSFQSGGST